MPQIIETQFRETVRLADRLKTAQHVALFEWRANFRGEYQAVFLPALPRKGAALHDAAPLLY